MSNNVLNKKPFKILPSKAQVFNLTRDNTLYDIVNYFVKYRNAVYNNGSITDELWIHNNKNKSEQEIVRVCTSLQAMSQCQELLNEVSVFIACIHITDSDIRIRDSAYTALMKACKHKSECFTPDSIIIIAASLLHVYDDSREYATVILGELSKYRPSVITFDIYKQLY
jgi:hypothetical protein